MLWDDQQNDLLRQLWSSLSTAKLARRLKRTEDAIRNQAFKLRLPKKIEHVDWSQENMDEAMRLRREGLSATKIGEALNRSRNSILGFFFRKGIPALSRRSHPPQIKKEAKKQPVIIKVPLPKKRVARKFVPILCPIGEGVPFLNRRRDECAYLLDKHRCCGHRTELHSSWCAYHASIVFKKEAA